MVSQQILKGDWNEIKGKLRSKWGQLDNNEIERFEGNTTQLVGYIQRKTGEGKEKIEQFLNDLSEGGGDVLGRATETVKDIAGHAVQSAKEGAEMVADQARSGYDAAERLVQERPASSIVAAFGAGLITGVALCLLLRSDR